MSHNRYTDDDGRTVADMSGIERRPLLIPKLRKGEDKDVIREPEEEELPERPWEESRQQLDKRERRWFIGGALGATLAIGAVYLLAAFLFIYFLTKIL